MKGLQSPCGVGMVVQGPMGKGAVKGGQVNLGCLFKDRLGKGKGFLCTGTGLYPMGVVVMWLKNRQEEAEGVAYGKELHNGDWTFQTQVMLETLPGRGDVYAYQVEHISLETPVTVQWGRRLWEGRVGCLLPFPKQPKPCRGTRP